MTHLRHRKRPAEIEAKPQHEESIASGDKLEREAAEAFRRWRPHARGYEGFAFYPKGARRKKLK